MKEVYVVHDYRKWNKEIIVHLVLLPHKEPWEPLTEEDLEEIFREHNWQTDEYSLTGYPEWTGVADYVVDPYWMIAWKCLPVGWKRV